MAIKFDRLVSGMRLIQNRGGKWKTIGDATQPIGLDPSYGVDGVAGIKSLNIKYGPTYISVDAEFPIHYTLLEEAKINDVDSEISKLFSFDNLWKVEFGWHGIGESDLYTISDLKLFETGLEYDQELRTFMAKFKFVPRYSYILKDIPLQMLDKYREKLKRYLKDPDDHVDPETGHPLSLGRVISEILQECKSILESSVISEGLGNVEKSDSDRGSYGRNPDGTKTKWNGSVWVPIDETNTTDNNTYEKTPLFDENGKPYVTPVSKKATPIVSNRFINGSPDDIPDPEKIRIIMFRPKGGADPPTLNTVAEEFNSEPMYSMEALTDWRDKNLDMSVYQFISKILEKNGLQLMPMPYNIDSDGKMGWTIIQTDFNSVGVDTDEGEWEGIVTVKKQNTIDNQKLNRFVNDFGLVDPNKKNTPNDNSQLFDLHSNRTVVISVSANIDAGRSTYATAVATQKLVDDINQRPTGEATIQYQNSRYALISKQSHELNLETIGLPMMKVGDNIGVTFGGELFTGKYKIIELGHKIDGGSFLTDIRCIRLAKDNRINSTSNNKDVPMKELTEEEFNKPLDPDEVRSKNDGSGRTKVGKHRQTEAYDLY